MTEEELTARSAQLDQREAALTQRIVRMELASALAEAKCRPEALQDAAALLATAGTVELAEDGMTIAQVTLAGESTGVAAAARRFLTARPHFVAPDEPAPKGKPAPPAERPEALIASAFAPPKTAAKTEPAEHGSMSPLDLVTSGWSEKPA